MTYKHFKQHWKEECFKDGVLTIPDDVHELYEDCRFCEDPDIRKVVLPEAGVEIMGPVFQDCANLESMENFPCTFRETCEIVDEDTGELVTLELERQRTVNEEAFKGCFKLFKDQQSIDEYGFAKLTIGDEVYPIGYVCSDELSFAEEMTALIAELYEASGVVSKADFKFCKTLNRYGNDYEYVFENGSLYNKTNGTWVLFLPEYSNLHLVVPEWVEEVDIRDFLVYRRLTTIECLKFLGATNFDPICEGLFKHIERVEFTEDNKKCEKFH